MDFNKQVQNESIKDNFLTFMKLNLQNIYKICSKRCINNFADKDLSDKEKSCLAKCFDRKSETFQMSIDYLNKYSEQVEKSKKNEVVFTEEIKFG